MKKADGTYEDWAEDPIFRQDFLKHVLIAYYVLFGKYFIYFITWLLIADFSIFVLLFRNGSPSVFSGTAFEFLFPCWITLGRRS